MSRSASTELVRRLDGALSSTGLPAEGLARPLEDAVRRGGQAVVCAPPGAGKSTLLPLALLRLVIAEGTGGKVVVLEPRRVAARQIAERMASLLGEPVGGTVGYSMRLERKVSRDTLVEVVTEGVLTHRMVADPTLEGTAGVVFDEFHERSLQTDLALALCRQTRSLLRDDLFLVVMSATLDSESISGALGAPVLRSEGRQYPVETVYPGVQAEPADCAGTVARAVLAAHREHAGDILAFLPGEADIRRCAELLSGNLGGTCVLPLYGQLSPREQRLAVSPDPQGRRRVVLATPIAETSLTIEGVDTVVDSGLYRRVLYDPRTELPSLQTTRISVDMADQRAGRAGRLGPGRCYRLWTPATQAKMAPVRTPEILEADFAQLHLQVCAWGGSPQDLPFLTPPPPGSLARAREVLEGLGALDGKGRATPHGRRLSALPCQVRIAQMLLSAADGREGALACDIAAVLEEKDPLGEGAGSDLWERVSALRAARSRGHAGAWARVEADSAQYRRLMGLPRDDTAPDAYAIGRLVASAYPMRIASLRAKGQGGYLLASGEEGFLPREDPLFGEERLAVASLGGRANGGRIFLAAPLGVKDMDSHARTLERTLWDAQAQCAVHRRERRVGAIVVQRDDSAPSQEECLDLLCTALRKEGAVLLAACKPLAELQARVSSVAAWRPELHLPDISDEAVLAAAEDWVPVFAPQATGFAKLRQVPFGQVAWSMLDHAMQQAVDRYAPAWMEVPSGSRIALEYRPGGGPPLLSVRLQECFGMEDTPRVDGGRVPVLMELLSPGYKPVQRTADLGSFWNGAYHEVRGELARRYPRHAWPVDPRSEPAVRGPKRRN